MKDLDSSNLDDQLDLLVGQYSDRVSNGETPSHREFIEQVEAHARPGLERCLKMIDSGIAQPSGGLVPLVAGMSFGRYKLLREVGRGGMALVWLARDEQLQRAVALKILRPGLALEETHVNRFRREALAIAKLKHPHIVQIFDVGTEGAYHYLAMEYVEGPSLARVLEALPEQHAWSGADLVRATGLTNCATLNDYDQREASFENALLRLLAPVVDALHLAHGQGLVHRDIKPSNILLRSDGSPVVADFGLAKSDGDAALSMTGDPLGTPFYMSPEQAWLSEVKVDHRTDIYSFGVMLYEALSGERPFNAPSVLEVFEKIKNSLPTSVRGVERRISKDCAALVHKAMSHNPKDRYGDAGALREDLQRLLTGQGTQARRELGNPLMRIWTWARVAFSGHPFEYKTRTCFLGWPLMHIITGRRYVGQKPRVAKGWIAVGDRAYGFLAVGAVAAGVVALGGMSFGLLISWGGMAASTLFASGGIAVGTVATGGIALGVYAAGGMSFGYAVLGGFARGWYAMGGNANGKHVVHDGDGGLSEEEFWKGALSWFYE